MDYFVAKIFSDLAFPHDDLPKRLPTVDQVSMWAGLAETRKMGFRYYIRPYSENARGYLERLGIEVLLELYGPIHLEPGRIISFIIYRPETGIGHT